VFWVCSSIFVENLGLLLGQEGLSAFLLFSSIIFAKFELSPWKRGTPCVFGVQQHHCPKFGLSPQVRGTPGVFGVQQHHCPKNALTSHERGTLYIVGLQQHLSLHYF
jgi:hypothetical protein